MKKKILVALSYVLIVALTITGTVAYLNMTKTVKNTFNLSDNVDIKLDEVIVDKVDDDYTPDPEGDRTEAGNTYDDVYPGAELPKDPTVHANEGSADLYTRATVTIPGGAGWIGLVDADLQAAFNELTANTKGTDWTYVSGEIVEEDVVYVLLYTVRLNAGEDTTPVFEKIVIPSEFTIDELNQITTASGDADGDFYIDVTAEALQAAGFDSAEEAFAAYDAE